MRVTQTQRNAAIEDIKGWLQAGDTVYLRLGKVAASGMSRRITPMILRVQLNAIEDKPRVGAYHGGGGPACVGLDEGSLKRYYLGYAFSKLLGWSVEDQAIKVDGCGMDMGMHLVTTVAEIVFGDYKALKYVWL